MEARDDGGAAVRGPARRGRRHGRGGRAGDGAGARGRRAGHEQLRRRGRGGAPDRGRRAGGRRGGRARRQGRRHASRPARCWRASMRAPPSRRPAPATRRCARRRPRWTWRARTSSARSSSTQKQYISQAALDRAESQFKATQAQAAAQLAQAGAARTQSGFYVVRAPYAGVVAEVPVALGDMAMPGRALLTLYDPGALRVTAAVPQGALAAQPTGRARRVPGPARAAALARRRERAGAAHGRCAAPTRCSCASPAGRPGRAWPPACSRGSGCRRRASRPGRLFVPASAVVRRAEMTGVYVVDAKGAPLLRQVRLGRAGGRQVEVLTRRVRRRARRARPAGRGARATETPAMNQTRWASPAASPAYFQAAQITPLLALVALLLGVFAVLVTPREEEPQINVTMANVLIPFPGAVGARRRADGGHAGRAGAGADRRRRARDVGVAARPGGAHRAVQGRRAAHRGAGAAVRHGQLQRRLAAARPGRAASRSSSPRASTTCRSSR